jgi:hypothetical protein
MPKTQSATPHVVSYNALRRTLSLTKREARLFGADIVLAEVGLKFLDRKARINEPAPGNS